MKYVVFGLSISSSWGNGHATLWRALCAALVRRGHRVVFFEKDRRTTANIARPNARFILAGPLYPPDFPWQANLPDDVTAALDRDDAELERIATAARARALEEHTADRRAQQLEAILVEVAGNGAGAPTLVEVADVGHHTSSGSGQPHSTAGVLEGIAAGRQLAG